MYLRLWNLSEFEKDKILDPLNNIKRLSHKDDVRSNDLLKTGEHLISLYLMDMLPGLALY